MPSASTYEQPVAVSRVQQAFPADLGDLLPPLDLIPEVFQKGRAGHVSTYARAMAIGRIDESLALIKRDDVDSEVAWKHLCTIAGSFEPRHEHKEAALAWLISLWFRDVVPLSEVEGAETAEAAAS